MVAQPEFGRDPSLRSGHVAGLSRQRLAVNQFLGKPTRPEGGGHRRRASGTLRMVDD
jgi:hypothetical protein